MKYTRFRAPIALVGVALAALALAVPAGSVTDQPQMRGGQRGRSGQTLEDAMRIPQGEQPQMFDAMVSRVRVDVIVTDGDGNFVTDLEAGDFVVFEDGEEQEILAVQLIDLVAGEIHPLLGESQPVEVTSGEAVSRRSPTAVPTANEAGEAIGDPAPSAASELGAIIFLIDGPSLSPRARARFGDAWSDLLERTDNPQIPRAAYMVDNVGRLQELAPLGYDVETMRAAAETVRQAPFFSGSMNRRMFEIVEDLTNTYSSPESLRQLAIAKARTFEAEERNRSLATYQLLTSFADALWTRPGRTALVWVSTGIKLMQGGPYTAIFAQDPDFQAEGMAGARFDIVSPDAQIQAAQEMLHRAANGSNVSIYSVDPSLLVETRSVALDVELGRGAALLSTPAVQQSLDGLRDSMRMAAAETGGKAFIQATDIEMILDEIEADTSRFYLLTYEPPSLDGDGDYHEIRVEVSRDDTDVRARGGYVDHAPEDRIRRLIRAGLALPGAVTDLPVEVQVFGSRPPGGGPNVLLAVAVDGSEVGLMLTPDGERRVSLDLHSVALKGTRVIDEAHEQLIARSTDDGRFVSADNSPLIPTLVGYLAYQHEWTLGPGSYTFNVAVVDNVTGRIGAASIDIEIPPYADENEWGVSDPLLVTIDEAGRIHPVVLGRFLRGENVIAFVEVYGGQRPIFSGQVFLETADPDAGQQGTRLFPLAMRRAAGGVHHGMIPLPSGMPPGNYFVQLVITDPPADEHKIVRLPLEVVASPIR